MEDEPLKINSTVGSQCVDTLQFSGSAATNYSLDLKRDETLAKAEITVQVVIFVLAVFGNATVLAVLLPRKRTRMYLFMMHLSLADLFVAFCNVLPQLIWDITYVFIGNDFLCRLVKYLQIVAIYASSYVMLMSAVDRYIAICHPLLSHKIHSGRVHMMVLIAWILSLIMPIPQLFIFSYRLRKDGQYDCWAKFDPEWTLKLYITFFTFTVYFLPIIILALCYGRICYVVIKRSGKNQQLTSSRRASCNSTCRYSIDGRDVQATVKLNIKVDNCRRNGFSRAKIKTVRLTLAVVLCYVLCWTPFSLFQMWAAYDPSAPYTSMYHLSILFFILYLLLLSLSLKKNSYIIWVVFVK
jgi:hypothetical protein